VVPVCLLRGACGEGGGGGPPVRTGRPPGRAVAAVSTDAPVKAGPTCATSTTSGGSAERLACSSRRDARAGHNGSPHISP